MRLFKKKITPERSTTLEEKQGHELKSGEFAKKIEWSPRWSAGAPLPRVFSDGFKTFLIYHIQEHDPNWDGTYVKMIDSSSSEVFPLALVEFNGGTFRFGIANDEVFGALPLASRGLKMYSAHIVQNSTWLEEIKSIHKKHAQYSEDRWTDIQHYTLVFHDEILEVLASDYRIETYKSTFKNLASEVINRMHD